MKHIKKYNEDLGHDSTGMVPVTKQKYGNVFKATISINLNGYINDDRTEITLEEAKEIILKQLEELAGSNDGSELLANIQENQIKINTIG